MASVSGVISAINKLSKPLQKKVAKKLGIDVEGRPGRKSDSIVVGKDRVAAEKKINKLIGGGIGAAVELATLGYVKAALPQLGNAGNVGDEPPVVGNIFIGKCAGITVLFAGVKLESHESGLVADLVKVMPGNRETGGGPAKAGSTPTSLAGIAGILTLLIP